MHMWQRANHMRGCHSHAEGWISYLHIWIHVWITAFRTEDVQFTCDILDFLKFVVYKKCRAHMKIRENQWRWKKRMSQDLTCRVLFPPRVIIHIHMKSTCETDDVTCGVFCSHVKKKAHRLWKCPVHMWKQSIIKYLHFHKYLHEFFDYISFLKLRGQFENDSLDQDSLNV